MDVQCPKCHQTVVIRRELAETEKLVTHCPTCETAFIVKRKSKGGGSRVIVPVTAERDEPLPASANWHIRKEDGTILSFQSIRTLQTWVIAGVVSLDDEISRKGVQWKRVGSLPELSSFIEKTRKLHEELPVDSYQTPPTPPARGLGVGASEREAADERGGIALVPSGPAPSAAQAPDRSAASGEVPVAAEQRPALAPRVQGAWSDDVPAVARRPRRGHASEQRGWRLALLLLALLLMVTVALLKVLLQSDNGMERKIVMYSVPAPFVPPPVSTPPAGAVLIGAEPAPTAPVDALAPAATAQVDSPSAPAVALQADIRSAAPATAPEVEVPAATVVAPPAEPAPHPAAVEEAHPPVAEEAHPSVREAAAPPAAEEATPARQVRRKPHEAPPSRPEPSEQPGRVEGKPVPSSYDGLMEAANAAFGANPEEAIPLYSRAAQRSPGLVEPVAQLGWCYLKLGDTSRAFEQFNKAVRMSPRYSDSYLGLAQAYAKGGYTAEACAHFRQYLGLIPPTSARSQKTREQMAKVGCGP